MQTLLASRQLPFTLPFWLVYSRPAPQHLHFLLAATNRINQSINQSTITTSITITAPVAISAGLVLARRFNKGDLLPFAGARILATHQRSCSCLREDTLLYYQRLHETEYHWRSVHVLPYPCKLGRRSVD